MEVDPIDVEEYATQLLSNDAFQVTHATLKGPQMREAESSGQPWPPRLLQEVAIYRQGCVLTKLLKQVLAGKDAAGSEPGYAFVIQGGASLGFASMIALGTLTMSRPATQLCLALHEGFDERFLMMTLENAELIRASPAWDSDPLMYAGFGLELLANLARSSGSLRQSMRETPTFVPLVEYLVSKEHVKKARPDSILGIKAYITKLILLFAVSTECQEWVMGSGLLQVITSICESTKSGAKEEIVVNCVIALLKLSDTPGNIDILRKQPALLSSLRRHAQSNNQRCPSMWKPLEGRLFQGHDASVPAFGVGDKEIWKIARKTGFHMSVVCSLQNCAVKQEYRSRMAFSKCSRCNVAHYCSKEHQTLHWRTHKKHCFKPESRDAGAVVGCDS